MNIKICILKDTEIVEVVGGLSSYLNGTLKKGTVRGGIHKPGSQSCAELQRQFEAAARAGRREEALRINELMIDC